MDQGTCPGECGLVNDCRCERDLDEPIVGQCPDCGKAPRLSGRPGHYLAGCCAAFVGRTPTQAVKTWDDHTRDRANRAEETRCA